MAANRKIIGLFLYLISSMVWTSICGVPCSKYESPEKEKLIVADTLINNFPDSALKVVMSIDKSRLSKAENAHHDALLLYARYRNYLTDTITDDNIADKALEYLT